MAKPLATTGSGSSDYFEPEDPAFNEILQNTILPVSPKHSNPIEPTLQSSHTIDACLLGKSGRVLKG